MKRDYYEVLGIDKNADASAIKKAYRKLAKKYFPGFILKTARRVISGTICLASSLEETAGVMHRGMALAETGFTGNLPEETAAATFAEGAMWKRR